jgi:hypothetical protein
MKFEDVLPLVRVGRLIRRPEWKPGRCLGLSEYDLRNANSQYPPHIHEFERLDRSFEKSWSDLHTNTDILMDDWEIVPIVVRPNDEEMWGDHLAVLRELARELTHPHRPKNCEGRKNGIQNLSTALHELTEAYRTEDPARIKGALVSGIVAYTILKRPKKEGEREDD